LPKFNVRSSKKVSAKDREIVLKYVDLCLKEICKKEHEINTVFRSPIKIQAARKNLLVTIRSSFVRSRGGRDEIIIDVADGRAAASFRKVHEYKAFSKDPVIGSFSTRSKEKGIAWIVAHEMAHHIQYRYGPWTRWLKKNYRKPHGEGFQAIYRILRSRIVNKIPEPSEEEAA